MRRLIEALSTWRRARREARANARREAERRQLRWTLLGIGIARTTRAAGRR